MNSCKTEIGILMDEWIKFYTDVAYNKQFVYSIFKGLFLKTFNIVKHFAYQDSIDKKYISLLMILNDFSNTRLLNLSEEHKAACHLTHEMTKDCFAHRYTQNEMPVMIDIKNREISYDNVDLLMELIKNHE